MTKEKAMMMALKIINVCKRYGNEDRCRQCPFNFGGCIVTGGDGVLPADWRAGDVIKGVER